MDQSVFHVNGEHGTGNLWSCLGATILSLGVFQILGVSERGRNARNKFIELD